MPPLKGDDGSASGITPPAPFGVWGDSDSGDGVAGTSRSGDGVYGQSGKATGVHGVGGRSSTLKPSGAVGVWGDSRNSAGVFGSSNGAEGVHGQSSLSTGVTGQTAAANQSGVVGMHSPSTGFGVGTVGATLSSDPGAVGVGGIAANGTGVLGISNTAHGVRGINQRASGSVPVYGSGVWGDSQNGFGVYGSSITADGIRGESERGAGLYGVSDEGEGVFGESNEFDGVHGETYSGAHAGVSGINRAQGGFGDGVYAHSDNGNGLWAEGRNGIIARAHPNWTHNVAMEAMVFSDDSIAVYGYKDLNTKGSRAGYFYGPVEVAGSLFKAGGGFRIDHPLDPARKYLNHSFVESSDQKNIYDGVAVLDSNGQAVVPLPPWFESLNRDFRYQLTAIGGAAPNLHVAEEVSKGCFKIGGGEPRMRVSWQITGIRKDVWAKANPLVVEEKKMGVERGCYLFPELQGKAETKGIEWVRNPERTKRVRDMRKKAARAHLKPQKQVRRRGE